jgi:hypothetical protein
MLFLETECLLQRLPTSWSKTPFPCISSSMVKSMLCSFPCHIMKHDSVCVHRFAAKKRPLLVKGSSAPSSKSYSREKNHQKRLRVVNTSYQSLEAVGLVVAVTSRK